MTYLIATIWFAVGYTLATVRYEKKMKREQAMRDRYKWQLTRGK